MRFPIELDPHIIRRSIKQGIFVVVFMITAHAHAATQITIFSDGPISPPTIPNTEVTVWDLSLPERIEAAAPEFPYDSAQPERTAALARRWFASAEGADFSRKMHAAYGYMPIMFNCQIAKIPAIAFDNCRYVIYGTQDLRRAVQDYDDFMKRRR